MENARCSHFCIGDMEAVEIDGIVPTLFRLLLWACVASVKEESVTKYHHLSSHVPAKGTEADNLHSQRGIEWKVQTPRSKGPPAGALVTGHRRRVPGEDGRGYLGSDQQEPTVVSFCRQKQWHETQERSRTEEGHGSQAVRGKR